MSPWRASLASNFISENGIVAVFGDEDQFVKGGIRKINHPLSFRRGRMGLISDAYRREVASARDSTTRIDLF